MAYPAPDEGRKEYAVKQRTKNPQSLRADAGQNHEPWIDPEVRAFRSHFEGSRPLDDLIRAGAQCVLQAAIDAEVDDFLALHAERRDERGRCLVVRNG